jgi:metal-responsive CopG/Arc/MetJ family transcriptional regulator
MKKTPISIKFDADLLVRLDKFANDLPYPTNRTGLIETAVRQMLDREAADKRIRRK